MRTAERSSKPEAQGRRLPPRLPASPQPTHRAPTPRPASGCSCGGACPACGPGAAPRGNSAARPARSGASDGRRGHGDEHEADRFADSVAPATRGRLPRNTAGQGAPASPAAVVADGGRALDPATRSEFEARLGADLSRVRVHDDATAAASAAGLHADAYTLGEHIVFGPGNHRPDTPAGRHLLAHELAHTVQQGGSPQRASASGAGPVGRRSRRGVQGSFWDDVVSGVAAVGNAIGSAVSAVGEAIDTAAGWLGERLHDVAQWAINLVTELPARLLRLGQTLVEGFWGVITFIPDAIRALASGGLSGLGDLLWERLKSAGAWSLTLLSRVFDVVGGPEAAELVMRMMSHATPLTSGERNAAQAVMGEDALQWDQVRVAEGGFLHIVHALNGGRAFTSFHTINIPTGGAHGRNNTAIMVHELTHVYQYERVGSLYMGQAIHAQATIGYGYGGAAGLRSGRAGGRTFASYNREQQAQIAQDYYALFVATGISSGSDHEAYEPFIAELRRGAL